MDILKSKVSNLLDGFIREQLGITLTSWSWISFKNAVMGEVEEAIKRASEKEGKKNAT